MGDDARPRANYPARPSHRDKRSPRSTTAPSLDWSIAEANDPEINVDPKVPLDIDVHVP